MLHQHDFRFSLRHLYRRFRSSLWSSRLACSREERGRERERKIHTYAVTFRPYVHFDWHTLASLCFSLSLSPLPLIVLLVVSVGACDRFRQIQFPFFLSTS